MSSNDAAHRLAVQKNKDRLGSQNTSERRATRLEHINEELIFWKKKLAANLADTKIVDTLIRLRAEQTTLHLEDLYESSAILAKQKTPGIIAAYYADCAKLLAATNRAQNG